MKPWPAAGWLEGLRQSLATAENIAGRYQGLLADGATSALQTLESQAKVDKLLGQVQAEEREVARMEATASATVAGNEAQLRQAIETNLRAIANLTKEIEQTKVLISSEVTAPVAGTVFDLSVSRGSVVQAQGKPLLKLIPSGDLQAKVYLPNSAIGFIQPASAPMWASPPSPANNSAIPATVQRIGSMPSPPRNSSGCWAPGPMALFSGRAEAGTPDPQGRSTGDPPPARHEPHRRCVPAGAALHLPITGALEKRLRSLDGCAEAHAPASPLGPPAPERRSWRARQRPPLGLAGQSASASPWWCCSTC